MSDKAGKPFPVSGMTSQVTPLSLSWLGSVNAVGASGHVTAVASRPPRRDGSHLSPGSSAKQCFPTH